MKREARIALGFGVLALLVLAILLSNNKPEPEYKGRRLSEWLLQMVSIYPRADREAAQALHAMGQGAVRSLMEMAENEDSALKRKILQQSDKFPVLAELLTSKHWDSYVAVKALAELGTNAAAAVPVLKKLEGNDDALLASAASAALVLVQNESIEAIAADCFNYEGTNSSRAYGLLLHLGPHAKIAVPRAIAELQSTNDRVRLRTGSLLAHIGIESPECVAAFITLLGDPHYLMRVTGIDGLANCGELAAHAPPLVATLLDDPEPLCRSSALSFLMRVVPAHAFEPYRNKVRERTGDSDPVVRQLAEQVLREKQPTK